ncbi:MAG: hypothetical protein HY698_02895 [Deltaproteobacteria bacterium]|nr:hypothetical protein [Deltaproteobacteria bacterium]
MAGKRALLGARQAYFSWIDPTVLLDERKRKEGEVVFEVPFANQVATATAPRLPRIRQRRTPQAEPASMGLPFGAHDVDGRLTCWSCAQVLGDNDVLARGPNIFACPGCGARLPFVE